MSYLKQACAKCAGKGIKRYVVLAADHRSQKDNYSPCRSCRGTGEVSRKSISVKLPSDSITLLLNCLQEIEERTAFGPQTFVFAEVRQAIEARLNKQ